jgi:hypothetical protein
MSRIMHLRLVIAGLCVAILACAANGAISAQGTGSPAARVCSTGEPRELTEEYRWRWRAHHNLSCVIDTLEQAMHRPANVGKDQVTLSRDEVEQLRDLTWWARDAAQRIGR